MHILNTTTTSRGMIHWALLEHNDEHLKRMLDLIRSNIWSIQKYHEPIDSHGLEHDQHDNDTTQYLAVLNGDDLYGGARLIYARPKCPLPISTVDTNVSIDEQYCEISRFCILPGTFSQFETDRLIVACTYAVRQIAGEYAYANTVRGLAVRLRCLFGPGATFIGPLNRHGRHSFQPMILDLATICGKRESVA